MDPMTVKKWILNILKDNKHLELEFNEEEQKLAIEFFKIETISDEDLFKIKAKINEFEELVKQFKNEN